MDGTQLSALSGELNFPLRDPNLRIMPSAPVRVTPSSYNSYWYDWVCNPYCGYVQRFYTQTNVNSTLPVEVRSSSLHGNGNLSWATSSCSGECPPWFSPSGYSQMNASVVSAQDAGSLNMYGPAPIVQ